MNVIRRQAAAVTLRFNQPLRGARIDTSSAPNLEASQPEERSTAQLEQEAYARGVIDGEQCLTEQLLRQRNDLLTVHNGVIAALKEAIPQVTRQAEEGVIQLAFEIAQKLVSELPVTRELVAGAVREALGHVEHDGEVVVLLNEQDLPLLSSTSEGDTGASFPNVRLAPSNEVGRGECMVQTPFGIVDCRRETKCRQIAASLRGAE